MWVCVARAHAQRPRKRVTIARIRAAAESRKGAIATLSRIVKEEGFVGLWRGNGTNCLRVFPSKAVLFSANDVYKSNLRWMMGRERLSPGYGFVTGSIAGVTACFCTYPLDFARTRLSGAFKGDNSGGLSAVLRGTLREEGFRGLYKGIYPTLLGSLLYEGIKFGAYDTIAWSMPKVNTRLAPFFPPANVADACHAQDKNGNLSIVGKLSAGAIAGSLAGFTVYPNDTVRRLLQMQKSATSGHSIKYTT